MTSRIAEDAIAADHLDKLLARHGVPIPSVIHHKTIVDQIFMWVIYRMCVLVVWRNVHGARTSLSIAGSAGYIKAAMGAHAKSVGAMILRSLLSPASEEQISPIIGLVVDRLKGTGTMNIWNYAQDHGILFDDIAISPVERCLCKLKRICFRQLKMDDKADFYVR